MWRRWEWPLTMQSAGTSSRATPRNGRFGWGGGEGGREGGRMEGGRMEGGWEGEKEERKRKDVHVYVENLV